MRRKRIKLVFMAMFGFMVISTNVALGDMRIPQDQRDIIRYFYTEQIMNIKPDFVRLQGDVLATKYAFSTLPEIQERPYPELGPMELVKIFSNMDLELEDFFQLVCIVIGFDLITHPDANLKERVSINQDANDIHTLGEYLDWAVNARIAFYRESRMILVMPEPRIDG